MRLLTPWLLTAILVSSPSARPLMLSTSVGGTFSFLSAEFPQKNERYHIDVKESRMAAYGSFGGELDLQLTEYIRVGIGARYEKRGGILRGDITMIDQRISLQTSNMPGEEEFDMRYLQLPIRIQATLPLLIPGTIIIGAGPEAGFLLESHERLLLRDANDVQYEFYRNVRDRTAVYDLGMSAALDYELLVGWNTGVRIGAGYYHGFSDWYQDDDALDRKMNHRAVRFAASWFVILNSAKP